MNIIPFAVPGRCLTVTKVDLEVLSQLHVGQRFDGNLLRVAGIIDDYLDLAEGLDGLRDRGAQALVVGQIHLQRKKLSRGRADRLRQRRHGALSRRDAIARGQTWRTSRCPMPFDAPVMNQVFAILLRMTSLLDRGYEVRCERLRKPNQSMHYFSATLIPPSAITTAPTI